jgi:ribokinase
MIAVAGLINLETNLRVAGFPLEYAPALYPFYGVDSAVSGVGFNVARALRALGNEVRLLGLIGRDAPGELARLALPAAGLPDADVLPALERTPQSVILYDGQGRRQIHTDLKGIREQVYPPDRAETALAACDWAVLANINFSRPMLARARALGKPIATDVHALASLDDDYNQDYLRAADVLFLSHERLPEPPEDFARRLLDRSRAAVIVIGLGADGALLAERGQPPRRFGAAATRPVVNTIGAGDALFSAFVHFYARGLPAEAALQRAQVFASWKIGASGGAEGFLSETRLEEVMAGGGTGK